LENKPILLFVAVFVSCNFEELILKYARQIFNLQWLALDRLLVNLLEAKLHAKDSSMGSL
jgi:hypothetical protein